MPEPLSLALIGIGLMGLGLATRKRVLPCRLWRFRSRLERENGTPRSPETHSTINFSSLVKLSEPMRFLNLMRFGPRIITHNSLNLQLCHYKPNCGRFANPPKRLH